MTEIRREVLTFVAVGLCVSVIFALVSFLMARAGVHGAWSNVAAYTATTPVAFLGQSRLTFKKTDRTGAYLVKFLVAVVLINGAIHVAGRLWPPGASQAALALVAWLTLTVGNFLAFKFWVFR